MWQNLFLLSGINVFVVWIKSDSTNSLLYKTVGRNLRSGGGGGGGKKEK